MNFGGQRLAREGAAGTPNFPRPILQGPLVGSLGANCFKEVKGEVCRTEDLPQFMNDCPIGTACPRPGEP